MEQIRIVAIPTKVVESVRATMLAPGYGFPAHSELGADPAPCRRGALVFLAAILTARWTEFYSRHRSLQPFH